MYKCNFLIKKKKMIVMIECKKSSNIFTSPKYTQFILLCCCIIKLYFKAVGTDFARSACHVIMSVEKDSSDCLQREAASLLSQRTRHRFLKAQRRTKTKYSHKTDFWHAVLIFNQQWDKSYIAYCSFKCINNSGIIMISQP